LNQKHWHKFTPCRKCVARLPFHSTARMAAIGWNQQTLCSRQLTTSGVLANNDQRNVTNRRCKTGC